MNRKKKIIEITKNIELFKIKIEELNNERIELIKAEMSELAKEIGIENINDLFGYGTNGKNSYLRRTAPKYRNPDNPIQTWGGRGRPPRWAIALKRQNILENNIIDKPVDKSSKYKRKAVLSPLMPKYRNPDDPTQTWAGRGNTPKWFTEHIEKGATIESMSCANEKDAQWKKDGDIEITSENESTNLQELSDNERYMIEKNA